MPEQSCTKHILLPNQGWSLSSIEHLMVLVVDIHLDYILHYARIMWYILYASKQYITWN